MDYNVVQWTAQNTSSKNNNDYNDDDVDVEGINTECSVVSYLTTTVASHVSNGIDCSVEFMANKCKSTCNYRDYSDFLTIQCSSDTSSLSKNNTTTTTTTSSSNNKSTSNNYHNPSTSTSILKTNNRLVYLYLIVIVNVICNKFVISVNCDELMETVGARGHFTPTWAVHIPDGDEVAARVAADHGMVIRGKIFDDHYHFEHHSISKRSIAPSHHHQQKLNDDDRVHWSKQQRARSRQKRDFTRLKALKSYPKFLNDPKWPAMWYLNRGNGYDMNVIPAWREGITGKGVVVTILDDGLEVDHPDLESNYDPEASWDVNSHDADPMPHYDMTDSNRHGTRCAGEVAATANNSMCAVGIAYGAKVGGVRMLDGDVTDAVEAQSLGLKPQHIDIYSASWGPDDDGKTVDGPGEMATRAFIEGVTKGRAGKGSIFIWASGNGGREQDNCNCDGYTNSIWTLSISSATEEGDVPWYSEKCSSTLATTYSSGQQGEKQVITTDLHHTCTISHTGTSASAPLAAGIAALALEANRNITWRDLQHIVVRTANPANLGKVNSEWSLNGVGRRVSHSFGYGLMDAAAMVRTARTWQQVPEQQRCEIHSQHLDKHIPPHRNVTFSLKVEHCKGVNYLEHVQAKISLTTQRRGDIVIFLTSPSGTRVTLLTERVHDVSRSGFNDWPFMSVHTWGEAPHGTWELEIHNKGRYMEFSMIRGWTLVLYGTAIPPHEDDEPLIYRQPVPPPTQPPVFYNNYYRPVPNTHVNYNSMVNNPNPNRKPVGQSTNLNQNQNQNQQQKATTVMTSSTTTQQQQQQQQRKNGKQKNGKGNKNNNQRTTSTTSRPNYSTVLWNQFQSNSQPQQSTPQQQPNNKNKLKNQNANANNRKFESDGTMTSTGFNRITTTMRPRPTSKLPNAKNNQNLNANNNNNNYLSNTNGKFQQSYSNVYEKSPGKAPKQVKENAFTTADIDFITKPTQNPSISKMFGKYEKIQQIYPEFQPYKESQNIPAYSQQSAFSVSTNGKPSRENPKSFSNFVAAELPQKKNPNDVESIIRHQSTSQISSSIRNGTAQITQWDLIFYGTDEPPQKNDPPRVLGKMKNVNDLEHNSLDSSHWGFITQDADIGSHSDVQRTVDDDLTKSACVGYSFDKSCLDCSQQTFLFGGKCFMNCPERSFMVPEKPIGARTSAESQTLSLKRGVGDFDNLDDILGTTKGRRAIKIGVVQKTCDACHSSCQRCSGPLEFNCLACDSELELSVNGQKQFCHPININNSTAENATNTTTMDNIKSQLKNYSINQIILISSLIGIIILLSSITIYLLCINCECDLMASIIDKTKQVLSITRTTNANGSSNASTSERDRNFSGKYVYNPILEMSETRKEKFTIQNDNDEDFDEDSDSDF